MLTVAATGKLFQVGRLQSAGSNNAGSYNQYSGRTTMNAGLAGGWSTVTYHQPFADDLVSAITQVQSKTHRNFPSCHFH